MKNGVCTKENKLSQQKQNKSNPEYVHNTLFLTIEMRVALNFIYPHLYMKVSRKDCRHLVQQLYARIYTHYDETAFNEDDRFDFQIYFT
jgi:hypothetical protein